MPDGIRWRYRRQISLRGLLVLCTFLGVVVALVSNFVTKGLKQAEIVAWVEGTNGTIEYGETLLPSLICHFVKDETFCRRIVGIEFGRSPSRRLEPLLQLEGLRRLAVYEIDDDDLRVVSRMSGLEEIWIRKGRVSDISPLNKLEALSVLYLESADLSEYHPIAGIANLRELRVVINDHSDVSWVSNSTKLEILALGGADLGDLSQIQGLVNLRQLHLYYTRVSDIMSLANLPELQLVHLERCTVTLEDVDELREALPSVDIFLVNPLSKMERLSWP